MDFRETHTRPEGNQAFKYPSPEEIRAATMRGRQLQAEVVRAAFVSAYRGCASLAGAGVGAFLRWQERRAARSAHEGGGERTLAEIGVPREQVRPGMRLWRTLRERLAGARARRREQMRIYRELMLYSDEELNELGVERRDIPKIARAA